MKSRIVRTGTIAAFPAHTGERVYMEPFRQRDGLPASLRRWQPVVDAMLAGVETDGPIYLMVHQGTVDRGGTLRRPGPHVDGDWIAATNRHGDPPLPPGHTNPAPSPGGHRNPMHQRELVILTSDVYGCDALLGDYTGRFGIGGDCADTVDLTALARYPMQPFGIYRGNVYTVHEAIPQPGRRPAHRRPIERAAMNDKEFEEWGRKVTQGVAESQLFCQLFNRKMVDDPLSEPHIVMQLGLAVLLDKPIIVTRFTGESLPNSLARLAYRVINADRDDPARTAAELHDAIDDLQSEGRIP